MDREFVLHEIVKQLGGSKIVVPPWIIPLLERAENALVCLFADRPNICDHMIRRRMLMLVTRAIGYDMELQASTGEPIAAFTPAHREFEAHIEWLERKSARTYEERRLHEIKEGNPVIVQKRPEPDPVKDEDEGEEDWDGDTTGH